MQIVFLLLLFILGACFGSFLCCQARRLHLKTHGSRKLGRRSVCLSCKKTLKWYDNIPIISWLILKGKCRHCHKKIGIAEIISEVSLAVAFLLLGLGSGLQFDTLLSHPEEEILFVAMLIFTLVLTFLAIYDGLYGELPTFYLVVALIFAVLILIIKICQSLSKMSPQNIIFSVLILGGLYLVLYLISKGKWVGDGDWLLATAIAIVLGSPWLALIALFLTNFLALLSALPHLKKTHQIHLGPFMVAAFVIVTCCASFFNSIISMV